MMTATTSSEHFTESAEIHRWIAHVKATTFSSLRKGNIERRACLESAAILLRKGNGGYCNDEARHSIGTFLKGRLDICLSYERSVTEYYIKISNHIQNFKI